MYNIDGVLLVDKPIGITSNRLLQIVKKLYCAKKAGHTGTLDPLATGLLPICFGNATKFGQALLDANKEYIATLKLGVTTTTFDAEGDVLSSQENIDCTLEQINQTLSSLVGEIEQTPPIYSALKVNGKPLYSYARSNQEVTIKSRIISIYEIELIENKAPDFLKIRVLCSKGTYIRSLAHEIGQKLGCGAHLSALTRTQTGNFKLSDATNLECLSNKNHDELKQLLLPCDSLVASLYRFDLTNEQYDYIKNGHQFTLPTNTTFVGKENELLRLYYNDVFLGLAQFIIKEDDNQTVIKPKRLMSN